MHDMKMLKEDLNGMMEVNRWPCVSVYMPTHSHGPETQQDPITLKNLLKEAEKQLTELGLRGPEAKRFLSQATGLVQDGSFWRRQAAGLALFISREVFKTYRLPNAFEKLLVVTDRFHFRPLLRLFNMGDRFYVLALGKRLVKLIECTRHGVEEVDLGEGVPKTLEEALKYDEPEAQLRFHTIAQGPAARGVTMFHGQGVGIDESKSNILRFFHMVHDGVSRILGKETAPLVLAGLDHHLPIYREVNSYPHLVPEGIARNPETMSVDEIHTEASKLMEPYFRKVLETAVSRYGQASDTRLASEDVREIVPAAFHGRVERLFVPSGRHVWGGFDQSSNSVHFHDEAEAGDADLLDLAAIQTFLHGGEVHILEQENMPSDETIAAVFRY